MDELDNWVRVTLARNEELVGRIFDDGDIPILVRLEGDGPFVAQFMAALDGLGYERGAVIGRDPELTRRTCGAPTAESPCTVLVLTPSGFYSAEYDPVPASHPRCLVSAP